MMEYGVRVTILTLGMLCVMGLAFAKEPNSVIIVGGGLAGLTSAYELEQAGYQVTLLEARNRLGGRVFTQKFPNGQYAELGSEYLDAPSIHRQIHYYLNRFGLEVDEVGYDDKNIAKGAYYIHGKLFAYDDLENVLGEQGRIDEERFWEAMDKLAEQVPDATQPQNSPNAKMLDAQSAYDWVKSLKLMPEVETIALHHIRSEYGEPSRLSLLFLAQQQKAYENIDDDEIEIYRIKGGNAQLINKFAKNIHGQIKLSSPVKELQQDNNQVVAITKDGKHYQADYAIVSTPATVLHKIKFDPDLPDIKNAGSHIHYGQHNKVLLQYKDRFWLKQNLGGDTISDLSLGWTWDGTDRQMGSSGILVTYSSGDFALQDNQIGAKHLLIQRQKQMEQMYPEAKGQLMHTVIQRWKKEPYIQGGFSAYAPNQVVPYWTAFHQPHGRIYFAGEHTDDLLPGYMEGAIRSGQRAAKQIIEKDKSINTTKWVFIGHEQNKQKHLVN